MSKIYRVNFMDRSFELQPSPLPADPLEAYVECLGTVIGPDLQATTDPGYLKACAAADRELIGSLGARIRRLQQSNTTEQP